MRGVTGHTLKGAAVLTDYSPPPTGVVYNIVIIYVMGTCSHKATDRLQVRSANIYNKVHSAVEIFDFGNGVWFL